MPAKRKPKRVKKEKNQVKPVPLPVVAPKPSRFAPARRNFRRAVHSETQEKENVAAATEGTSKGLFLNPFKTRKYHTQKQLGLVYRDEWNPSEPYEPDIYKPHPLKLESGRPRSQMTFVGNRTESQATPFREGKWVGSTELYRTKDNSRFPPDPNLWLPIHRIDQLYHAQGPTKYCGKFYFVEPQSQVMLHLGHTAIFGSKLAAWISLWSFCLRMRDKYQNTLKWTEFYNELRAKASLDTNVSGLLPLSGRGQFNIMFQNNWTVPMTHQKWRNHVGVGYYMSVYPDAKSAIPKKPIPIVGTGLYPCYQKDKKDPVIRFGGHDNFDQPLCLLVRMLRKYGFLSLDTLIFQHELGLYRATTEILDTRSDPYDTKLFRRVPAGVAMPHSSNNGRWYGTVAPTPFEPAPCRTVWFLRDGFFRPESSKSKSKWHKLVYGQDWSIELYDAWWTTKIDWKRISEPAPPDTLFTRQKFPHTTLNRWYVREMKYAKDLPTSPSKP